MLFRRLHLVAILAAVLVGPAAADNDDNDRARINVHDHGAVCDGRHDDTFAFTRALQAVASGGAIFVPSGKCVLTQTLIISKPVTITGTGFASQIYGNTDRTLFQFVNVNNAAVRDLYLGSRSSAIGISLIKLVNSHHNQISNVTMLGGYYGVHLFGSLLNTFIDLRSGVNFGGFFGQTSKNTYWVFAERDHTHHISSNANTFIAPSLEGGTYGIYLEDLPDPSCPGCIRNGEGSLQIIGGTIEGVSQTALTLKATFLATSVTGVHFEANGADVLIDNATNIRLASITSLGGPGGSGAIGIKLTGPFTRNIQISDSIVQQLTIDSGIKRILLQNLTTDLQCSGTSGITPTTPSDPSIIYTNVGLNCT